MTALHLRILKKLEAGKGWSCPRHTQIAEPNLMPNTLILKGMEDGLV